MKGKQKPQFGTVRSYVCRCGAERLTVSLTATRCRACGRVIHLVKAEEALKR